MIKKFDVVIGNPPYQKDSNNSQKLWTKFVKKSFEICKEDGYVSMITPFSWSTPNNNIFELFKNNETQYINLNGKKYFPNIGTTISWYIIKNNKNFNSLTIIDTKEEKINIDIKNSDFLPSILNNNVIQILNKILCKKNDDSIQIKYDSFCHSQRIDRVSTKKDESHIYCIKHTAKNNIYSNVRHPNTLFPKVIFPISSAMKAEYDKYGDYGCSEHYAWIQVENDLEAEIIIKYLNSNIIKFLRKTTQWTASWSKGILDKISKVPLDKIMSNNELYSYFDLSDDEIKYIEEFF